MPTVNHTTTKVKRVFSILKVQKDLRDAKQLSDSAQRLAGQMLDIISSVEDDSDVRVCRVSLQTLQTYSGKKERQVRNLLRELEAHQIFVRVETGKNIPVNITNTWIFDDAPLAILADESRKNRKKKTKSSVELVDEVRQKIAESRQEITKVAQIFAESRQKATSTRQKTAPSSGSFPVSSLGSSQDLQQQQHSVSFVEHSPETRAARQSVATAPDQAQNLATARADQITSKDGVGGEQRIESVAMDDVTMPFDPKPNMPHNITTQAIDAGRVELLAAYAKVFSKPLVQSKSYVRDSIAVIRACYIAAADSKSASGINRPSRLVHRAMEALRSDITARDSMPNTTKQDPIKLLASKISAYDITRAEPRKIEEQIAPMVTRRRHVDGPPSTNNFDPPVTRQQPSASPLVAQNSPVAAPVDIGAPEQAEQHQDAPNDNVGTNNAKPPSNWDLVSEETKQLIRTMAQGKSIDTDKLAKTSPYRRAAVA